MYTFWLCWCLQHHQHQQHHDQWHVTWVNRQLAVTSSSPSDWQSHLSVTWSTPCWSITHLRLVSCNFFIYWDVINPLYDTLINKCITTFTKGPCIATQLNSIQLDVELSWVVSLSTGLKTATDDHLLLKPFEITRTYEWLQKCQHIVFWSCFLPGHFIMYYICVSPYFMRFFYCGK